MPAPVAVHVGYHKTATTWLQRDVFPHHPRLHPYVEGRVWNDPFLHCIVAETDREFDAERARVAYETGLLRLAGLGPSDVVVVSAERLSGHAASGGYDTYRIAGRLHATLPEARVLIVVRSQIDMIESEYRQLVGEGYPGRISSLWSSDRWKTTAFDLGHYEYDGLVREYQQRFGADQVAVFTYEGIVAERDRFLDRLADFLGVAPFDLRASGNAREVHPGLPNRGLGILRAMNHLRRSELNRFPIVDLGTRWRGPIVAVARRLPNRRHLIPAARRAELAARYRDSNDRLAKLAPGEDFRAFAAALDASAS
jgi:hypothetical protein